MFQLKRLMGSAALLALGFASNASGVLAQDARAAAATLPPVYTDARIVEWSADFLAARKAKLEQSVAADLARQDAHILSAHVWLRVQESLGRSRDQAVAAAPPEGRSRVQAEATLEMLEEQGRSDQILARFAPENLPRLSYFAQFILSEAADQLGRVDEALRYRMLRLEVDPDGFAAAWDMVDHIGADQRESTRRALRARLDVAELRPSLSARYLGRILQDPGLLLVDKRALAQTLWRERPDWYQLRFLAGVECNLHRPKQCAALRRQADALYPFRNGVVRIAVALMLGGQDAEARRLLHERALLFAPPGAPAQRRETLDLVAALGEAGEYGEQRKALNEALVRYPDEVALHLAMARLDAFSNRPAQAAEQWREVLRLAPQHLDAWLGLIRAHRSADDPDGAADVLRRAQTTLGTLTPSLMIESLGLLQARAWHGEAVLAGESALARWPLDAGLLRTVAKSQMQLDQAPLARELLQRSIASAGVDRSTVTSLLAIADRGGSAAGDAELDTLQARYPTDVLLVDIQEERLTARNGDNRRPTVLAMDAAVARAPKSYWPHYYRAWTAMRDQDGEGMRAAIERGLDSVPSDLLGRRAELLARRVDMGLRLANDITPRSAALLDAIQSDLDQVQALELDATSIARWRADLLQKRGDEEGSARQRVLQASLSPDDKDAVWGLIRSGDEFARKHSWPKLDRYVKRNPYSSDRLELALQLHALWGGSPVVALSYARTFEERFPDEWRKGRGPADKQRAMQQLGLYQQFYREQYDQHSSIPAAQRYVNWYDDARSRAQGDSSFLLPEKLDLINMRATIVNAEGIELERAWHPVSGKLTYVRMGRAEMSASYDANGINLTGMKDSVGAQLRLDYNADDQILRFVPSAGEELSFEYGPQGKPVRITIKDLGSISVAYDEQGEISKVESSGGAGIALKVTQAFQQLLSQVKVFNDARGDFPELPYVDKPLQALSARAASATGASRLTQQLALAEYLVAHVGDRRDYASQAREQLDAIYQRARASGSTANVPALQAVALWHRLAGQIYRHGLSETDLLRWADMQAWLAGLVPTPQSAPALARLRADILRAPLDLLASAHWLPRSYIDNPGMWRRHPLTRVLPGVAAADIAPTALLLRRNGDVLLGSRRGLSVLRRGFWEWFGYDRETRQLSANLAPGSEQPAVLALAEDAAGHLWIGLENALLRLDGDYDGDLRRYASAMQGLANPRVEQLAAFGDAMLVATPGSLRLFGDSGSLPLPAALKALEGTPVRLLRASTDRKAPALLIGTDKALFALGQTALGELAPYAVQDARYHEGRIYALRNNELTSLAWPLSPQRGFERVPGAGNILFARSIEGLGQIALDDGGPALAVLTDLGVSILHNAHFEHKKLPLAERDVAVQMLVSAVGRTILSTSEGIYALQFNRDAGDRRGRVHDLFTIQEHGATFVARGDRLDAVVHSDAGSGARNFARLRSTHLARDALGGLITNDGNQIVRIAAGSTDVVELFAAPGRDNAGQPANQGISSLLVASDGAIWVTASASVFRHAKGQTTEYSIYLDEGLFPARSNMISRVLETTEHRIWVVASDEGHLAQRGRPMIGGLLEWNGVQFTRQDVESNYWRKYITGYTPIGAGQAIVGTPYGFASQNGEQWTGLGDGGNISYNALKQRQPMLFLGTRGAPMGDDSWFFGTAGGLVAWHAGRWILPDRLNWLLPDPHLAAYGARAVHAVATDSAGRIYAGTDRGLMIYDSGGNDFLQFVLTENLPDLAFSELEAGKLRAESRSLLDKLPEGSRAGKIASSHAQSLAGLEAARSALRAQPLSDAGGAPKPSLAQELERRERAHKQLLAQLEKDSYALYQMLELKPIDLSVWRKRLAPDEVIVQYLPTRERLLIHLASRDRTEIREVQVRDQELFARSQAVSTLLATESARLRGVRGVVALPGPENLHASAVALGGAQGLQQELHWLYEQLLRPVEADLTRYQRVYITPVGALAHLPFGALVRSTGPKPEYAAQRHELGVLPSLYLLDLVLRTGERSTGGTLLLGNPDGTLPGAEREARSISAILGVGTTMRLGGDASATALRTAAPAARWLHLATHGHLNSEDPTQSYLVLSNGTRFTNVDIMELALDRTETVVLSACESGVGSSGLDYATLARSFATAGATSVVASLWQVNDDATEMLMTRFYAHRRDGKNVFLALAAAQRDMIARGGAAAAPAAWSGFLAFGKP